MPLKTAKTWKDSKGKTCTATASPDWRYLTDKNNACPGCGKTIYSLDDDVEYSKTKRGTHVFWHTGCTGKVWH